MSRPDILGRVLRVQPALLGVSLSCAAALTAQPPPALAGEAVPSAVAGGASALTSTPVQAVGASVAQLVGPGGLPIPPEVVRVKLRIRTVDLDVLDGGTAIVAGALRPRLADREVDLQRLGGGGWRTISHSHTGLRGRFVLRYVLHRLLDERVRVVFAGGASDVGARRNIGRLRSYRLVGASWYGGGGSLACGGQLTGSTMGVANKTLPCGTLVTLRYGGRSVRVPVIDRGPYVEGREFDLTEATKRALGFEGVGSVWSSQ